MRRVTVRRDVLRIVVPSPAAGVVLLVLATATAAGVSVQGNHTCTAGRWGEVCEYLCHCAPQADQCDVTTGACVDQCESGWQAGHGQTCQQRNVALGMPSNFSAEGAEKAVDGNRSNHGDAANSTCLMTPPGLQLVEWIVDLYPDTYVSDVYLIFRQTDNLPIGGFSVAVWSVTGNDSDWVECHHQLNDSHDLEYWLTCRQTAHRLKVYSDTSGQPPGQDAHLNLCEVEVYECSNGTFGQNCSEQCHCAGGRCDFNTGLCLDTGQCRDGWSSDSCTQKCSGGYFGRNCSVPCGHCDGNRPCHHVTGACSDGCAAGFTDPQNGCFTGCSAGQHGRECSQACGSCRNGDVCYAATGICPAGCKEGFQGDSCMTAAAGSTDNPDDGLPTTAVIGAVAAGGSVFLCCVCALAQIRKSRRKKRNSKYKTSNGSQDGSTVTNPIAATATAAKEEQKRKSSIFSGRKMSIFDERKKSVAFAGQERKKSIFAAVFGFAKDEDLSGLPVYNITTFANNGEVASEGLFNQDKDAGVPVDRFRQYVYGKRRGTTSIENEFKTLPQGYTATTEDSERPENNDKNKFPEYCPYDFNRVVLKAWGHGDYINASHIKDYKGKDNYIAAQAPCKKSASDFWHMVWQEKIGKIVMLTNFMENGKSKCDRYWTENGCVSFGDLTVKDAAQTARATYTIRSIKIIHKKTCETREVTHLQYTEWSEQSIPLVHDALEFFWRVRAMATDLPGPLLVHCSNGVGRTGTYIAVDSLLQQAEDTGRLDVKTYVELLRHQRKNMVLTKEQYAFVHAALIDGIILGDTRIGAAHFYQGFASEHDHLRIGYRKICEQFQELSYLKSSMAFRRDSGIENVTDLKNMNCDGITMQFVPSTLSANMFRLVDADEDTETQKFMAFLRTIDAQTVLCLHKEDLQMFTRCVEWTHRHLEEEEARKKAQEGAGSSDSDSEEEEDLYKMQKLSSSDVCPELVTTQFRVFLDDYDEVQLELMSLSGWGQDQRLIPEPLNPVIMTMADRIHTRQTQLGFHPVVVLIGEVQESAGLFCVLANIIHGIQLDDEVEVYSNVCRVRRLMPDICTSVDEFLYCHEFASKFANFQKAEFH